MLTDIIIEMNTVVLFNCCSQSFIRLFLERSVSMNETELKQLYELYVNKKYTMRQCAKVLQIDRKTISRHLKNQGWIRKDTIKYNLERDEYGRFVKKGQQLPPQDLHNNPTFKNGIQSYHRIAEIYRLPKFCYHCKKTKDLHIHHIDEDRTNNDPSNLRYVCNRCHQTIEHAEKLKRRDKKGRFI